MKEEKENIAKKKNIEHDRKVPENKLELEIKKVGKGEQMEEIRIRNEGMSSKI